jgi:hypothetical protein
MNEMDPGVDHMSAMKVIDEITEKGGKCFYSNPLWGLVAPVGYNRWNYKFNLGSRMCSACWARQDS